MHRSSKLITFSVETVWISSSTLPIRQKSPVAYDLKATHTHFIPLTPSSLLVAKCWSLPAQDLGKIQACNKIRAVLILQWEELVGFMAIMKSLKGLWVETGVPLPIYTHSAFSCLLLCSTVRRKKKKEGKKSNHHKLQFVFIPGLLKKGWNACSKDKKGL